MMDFETIQDFLDNERFSKWLKTSAPELDRFWKQWLEANEDKKELFYNAVSAWLLIGEAPGNWSEERVEARLSALKETMKEESEKRRSLRRYWYYAAAAVVFLVGIAGVTTFFLPVQTDRYAVSEPVSEAWETIENHSARAMLINLPDGSSALLSQGSTLSFHPEFLDAHRVVNLKGEAFFEVVKNTARPFYVHTSTLTTKVLGTSFRVRSFEGESDSKVSVMSGKVEVRASGSVGGRDVSPSAEGIILEKNEEAVLSRDKDGFVRSVPEPASHPVPELPEFLSFNLKFVPAPEIFAALEKRYGVKIVYDPARFSHCTLTANLEDVPFMKKLELICAGIDAEYSINGSQVDISGAGCRK